jgi:hypothetical protein
MHLRYALRILSRSPGFSAIAVFTLALGIGINTIVFTLYSAVALKPIAARAPEQLVRISGSRNGQRTELFAYWQYEQIRQQAHSFSDVIASSEPQMLAARLPEARESEVLRARLVFEQLFQCTGHFACAGAWLPAG